MLVVLPIAAAVSAAVVLLLITALILAIWPAVFHWLTELPTLPASPLFRLVSE